MHVIRILRSFNSLLIATFILLAFNNIPSHITIQSELTNIELHFIPANTTSIMQAADAGIIRAFKAYSRALLSERVLALMQSSHQNVTATNFAEKINILQAIHIADMAWKRVICPTISNCF